jgi:nucleotide-binding universal stress UspA family protein
MPGQNTTLLICYDGSDRAKNAIQVAARLFPGAHARVVHVWEPVEHIVARYAVLAPNLGEGVDQADKGVEAESVTLAQEGANLAAAAGLAATAHTETLKSSVWEAVIESSGALDVDLIVTGTRSLHGVQELLVGTLSHALLQHSQTPLLAIPMAN